MAATLVRDLRANLSLGMDDDEFQRGIEGLKRSAPRDGDAVAGAFAKSFSRQLGAAFRTLPRAQITADSSDADIKVNTLRESLRELANKRIGVDIDAASAFGEMRALRDELEGLSEVGDIAVRADVAKALAALGTVEHEVEKIDGQTANVDVDVKGAVQAVAQVGMLGRAVSSLAGSTGGPVAVAGAIALLPLAASAASVGIVTVLGGALAGLGLAASKGSVAAQAALGQLREVATAEAARIGQPFEKVWLTIVETAERELLKLSPVLQRNLAELAPTVQDFTEQAGSSLEELEPAIDAVQSAFSAVLKSLGPALPEIMEKLASGITSIASAAEDNADQIVAFIEGMATIFEWTGKVIGGLARLSTIMDELIRPGIGRYREELSAARAAQAAHEKSTRQVTEAAADQAKGSDDLSVRLAVLSAAYGLTGDAAADAAKKAADAAQKTLDSWSSAFTSMTSESSVISQIESTTRANVAAAEQQAAAADRLAETQRASAEKIKSAQQEVADAHARAADQVKQAERQLSDAHVRAADQVEQAQDRIKSSQESLAAAVEDAAQREADAVQGVESARQSAAQAAEASSRAIEQAAQRVEDTQRSAAQEAEAANRRIEQAVQKVSDTEVDSAARIVDAERRLQDSHAREAEALDDLTAARERAQQRLEDLARSATDGALDEEGAQIAIERARQRMAEVNADPKSTDLDKREADLSYRQALQRLDDIRARNADLAQELADANAAGVEGADEVVQAKEKIAEAQQAEQEAETALAKQRIDAARQVADAEQALSDARGEAATRQEEAARQVAAAEQSLADAHREAARQQEDASRALATAEAELNAARVAGAKDVAAAQKDVAAAQREAVKAAKDAARDVSDAEASVRKAHQDASRDIKDAEEAMRQARQDSARDIQKANDDVKKSWTDLGGSAGVTTQQFLAEMEKQVKAQEDWADNMIYLAGRVPDETLNYLKKLPPGAADQIALATKMTDSELRKFVDLHGRSGKEAGDTFAKNLELVGPVLSKIALERGQDVADKVREGMDHGRTSVFDAARRLGIQVDVGIGSGRTIEVTLNTAPAYGQLNELLSKIGLSSANVSVGVLQKSADGNIFMADGAVLSFAGGTENHVAQIAGPGTRVWAEPETHGEAYIPLADSKRSRSEQILAQVASTFGGMYLRPTSGGLASSPSTTAGAGGSSIHNTYVINLDGSTVQSPRDVADEIYLLSIGRGF